MVDDSPGHSVVGAHDWCLGLVLLLTVRGHYMRLMRIVGCTWLTLAVVICVWYPWLASVGPRDQYT